MNQPAVRRSTIVPLLALAAVGLARCKDTATPVIAPVPATLTVPDSVTVLEGDSTHLVATLKDSLGGTLVGYPIVWTSADSTVVTVGPTGIVHFRQPGHTTITALAGGLTAHTTVNAAVLFTNISVGSVYGNFAPLCGVTARGSLLCTLGAEGDTLKVVALPQGTLTQFALGTNHGCGLGTDSLASCWGSNQYGQLGSDTAFGSSTIVLTPVSVSGLRHFRALTAGVTHTCGLTADGAAYCWGHNSRGQLGGGDSAVPYATTPTPVAGGLTFESIAAGDRHTCGVTAGGSIYCWGSNASMALGTGDSTLDRADTPQRVVSLAHFVQVVASDDATCGLADDGTAYCWGNDDFHQLGVDSTASCSGTGGLACSRLPQRVSGGHVFQALGAHAGLGNGLDGLTCGLTTGGAAYCWGRNVVGEVGDGTTTPRPAPVPVAGGLQFSRLMVGDFQACALTLAGTVYCWGFNFGSVPQRLGDQP